MDADKQEKLHQKELDLKIADVAQEVVSFGSTPWTVEPNTYKSADGHTYTHDLAARTIRYNKRTHGTCEICVHHFWNGSHIAPTDPTEWPGITVRVHLDAGDYVKQAKIAAAIRAVLEREL